MGTENSREIFKVKGDGTIERLGRTKTKETKVPQDVNTPLAKEILEIIEVNSYSQKLLAAYRARKYANKVSKKKYGRKNYKEYVEMLMVKNYPKELEKAVVGKKYARCRRSLFFIVPAVFVFPAVLMVKYRKQLKRLYA